MGTPQSEFLHAFEAAFEQHTQRKCVWAGGQQASNTSGFAAIRAERREIGARNTERFELGDLATDFHGHRVIVEFESDSVPLSNLLKYWPYMRGEFTASPSLPIILCHFSDWHSYATRRDLWEWTLKEMQTDPRCKSTIQAQQFDHWGKNLEKRKASIQSAIHWIIEATNHPSS